MSKAPAISDPLMVSSGLFRYESRVCGYSSTELSDYPVKRVEETDAATTLVNVFRLDKSLLP